MKLVCIGDIGIDFYKNRDILKPGGIAFNVAVNAHSSGASVSLVSAVGTDVYGNKIDTLLKKIDINTTHLKKIEGHTALQNIILENTGERKFVGYNAGILKYWTLTHQDLDFIATHNVMFVPLSDGMEHIFESIKNLQTSAMKSVDFSQDYEKADFDKKENCITRYAKYFDIIFIGATTKQKSMIAHLSQHYSNKIFILTLGSKGSIAWHKGKQYEQPAQKVTKIIDTTGCGDAFQGTFIVTFIQTNDIQKSLKHASIQASSILKHIGSTKYFL